MFTIYILSKREKLLENSEFTAIDRSSITYIVRIVTSIGRVLFEQVYRLDSISTGFIDIRKKIESTIPLLQPIMRICRNAVG